ncbi:hypothetical protein SCHPADRAFT_819201 [Schizopora paradoxa]|uniref:ARM repeat-containing protein n=1 Tax=Schizopora paradoxa TaxID=27342 RepID=A0A0H2S4F3_9AGAM|nr:hypothetical protein SCHPADRAFT_819201 [Schizopora paradoxa]
MSEAKTERNRDANAHDVQAQESVERSPSPLPARGIIDWDRDVAPFLSQKLSEMRLADSNDTTSSTPVKIPDDIIEGAKTDRSLEKLRLIAQNLPYPIESNAHMQENLDHILMRIVQCVKARNFDRSLMDWNEHLMRWMYLKYPIPTPKRVALVKLYYEIATQPCMSRYVISNIISSLSVLTKSKKKITISDIRLPWKPIYDILSKNLFIPRRVYKPSHLPRYMFTLLRKVNRFFHPAAINEMMETMLPYLNGTDINSVLSTQFYLLSFLPQSHPQTYLPMLFHLWKTFNSAMFDGRMLQFLASLAEMHIDPTASDPQRIKELPDDARSEGEGRPEWKSNGHPETLEPEGPWSGIFKSVGIFSEEEWEHIMCKCLAALDIPLKDSISSSTGNMVDKKARSEVKNLPSPQNQIGKWLKKLCLLHHISDSKMTESLANIIVYSIHEDLEKTSFENEYLAKSHSLHSFVDMITKVKHCFHPSSSQDCTDKLTQFSTRVLHFFNKRWHEEQKEDCKTPLSHRLTSHMKTELVKTLQPLAMLAIYSSDQDSVNNAQKCLQIMANMEPELVLQPVVDQAVLAMKSLIEPERTTVSLRALASVSLALVSYRPAANQLLIILHMVLPGIDAVSSFLCENTAELISSIARHIKIDDIAFTSADQATSQNKGDKQLSFQSWVTKFFEQAILFVDNLPRGIQDSDESLGTPERIALISIMKACKQVIMHLSDVLFDNVLEQIFTYTNTSVTTQNIFVHKLAGYLVNASPQKTFAKFLPACIANIKTELEFGASSLKTISARDPIPSDSRLAWNIAILDGLLRYVCSCIPKYKDDLKKLIQLLCSKTFSKNGYTQCGWTINSALNSLTSSCPKDERFVNPDMWASKAFNVSSQEYWGQRYTMHDVKIDWQIPSVEGISFVMDIFHEIIQPMLNQIEALLETGKYLTIVSNAFGGISTLVKANFDRVAFEKSLEDADFPNLPAMSGRFELQNSAFIFSDPEHPQWKYISSLHRQFGETLHKASLLLKSQVDMNALPVIDLLLNSTKSFALAYGIKEHEFDASLDAFHQKKEDNAEYEGNKTLSRDVQIRRLKHYHCARQFADTSKKLQGQLENLIIDEVVEWAMSTYASGLSKAYIGVRHRSVPKLIQNMKSGTEVSRVKGVLWTFQLDAFDYLFPCLDTNIALKNSVQEQVAALFDSAVHSWSSFKPSVKLPESRLRLLQDLSSALEILLCPSLMDIDLLQKCTAEQADFEKNYDTCCTNTVDLVTRIAASSKTHWLYAKDALQYLILNISYEVPVSSFQIKHFLEMACNPHLTKLASVGVVTAMQHLKWREFSLSTQELVLCKPKNPLCSRFQINPEQQDVKEYLKQFSQQLEKESEELLFDEKAEFGWIVWPKSVNLYRMPESNQEPKVPETASQAIIDTIRETVNNEEFWNKYAWAYSMETDEPTISELHVSCIKSIFQILQDEPFRFLEPSLKELLQDTDMNKQRAAAEFLAGIIGAMKHWPFDKQNKFWDWFTPQLHQILGRTVRPASLSIWASFIFYIFKDRDPRRIQPLLNYVVEMFEACDFNSQFPFHVEVPATFIIATMTAIGWRSEPWLEKIVNQYWLGLKAEHGIIRNHIAHILQFSNLMKWRTKLLVPSVEMFIKECQISPLSVDLLGSQCNYNKGRVEELVRSFPKWREERLPGDRVFKSTYDRVGNIVCKWLIKSVYEIQASSSFSYILPLMPEILRFSELRNNPELSELATLVLDRICAVIPPKEFVAPVIDVFLNALKSPMPWRLHLNALTFLNMFHFRQHILVGKDKLPEILDVVIGCLEEKSFEVQDMAARSLSDILRISGSTYITALKTRFEEAISGAKPEDSESPEFKTSIRSLHANILGLCAVIDSNPYEIESWTPMIISEVLSKHTFAPFPISTTVQKWALKFKEIHVDTWEEDSKKFTPEQLKALETMVTGSSYCEYLTPHDRFIRN